MYLQSYVEKMQYNYFLIFVFIFFKYIVDALIILTIINLRLGILRVLED